MKVRTLRFGELQVPEENVITMARPILGFEHLTGFCLVDIDDLRPFLWLQSTEEPAVAFLVANPLIFAHDYRIEINPQEIGELVVDDVRSVETYVIVTIPDNPRDISANLQGPILINRENNLGKQLILVNSSYSVKHNLLDALDEINAARPAETELVEL
jgi:flagellar assembly factor FliW